jgi:signal transduction histidine kinase
MGFQNEATAMTLQAQEIMRAEQDRERELEKAKVDLSATRARTDLTLAQTGDVGATGFTRLLDAREAKIAEIETSKDPDQIALLQSELGYIEGNLAKQNFISLSDADERALSKAALGKVNLELLDSELLDTRLGELEGVLRGHKGSLASTAIGRFGAGAVERMEAFFGIDPGTYGADTLLADVQEIGSMAAFVSSEIRHALTGAAMSAQEAPLLEPFLATPGDSISKMLAKVETVRRYTQLDIAQRKAFLNAPAEAAHWMREMSKQVEKEAKNTSTAGGSSISDEADSLDGKLEGLVQERMNRNKP